MALPDLDNAPPDIVELPMALVCEFCQCNS